VATFAKQETLLIGELEDPRQLGRNISTCPSV
jgi:hypothetical protein